MDRPGVAFARAPDGAYLAYQAFGDGPIDIVWQDDFFSFVDEWWDDPAGRALYEGMARFARVVLHDRRGTGCSSRDGGPANLETRVSDTLAVMDTVGARRPVVGGVHEGGASMVLLAATHPERVRSLVWFRPVPRATAAADYPWGVGPEYIEKDRAITEDWGTEAYARAFMELNADVMEGPWSSEAYVAYLARLTRRTCTPDVAEQLNRIWYETDVRGVLPTVQVSTLLIVDQENSDLDLAGIGGHVAELMPDAQVEPYMPMDKDLAGVREGLEQIRRFIGVERPPDDLDSVLATVLFTDIVDSTKRSAELGDRDWSTVRRRHDEIVRTELGRHRGREIKTMGDGFLATFEGPARGVHCARAIVDRVRELGLEIRAGLHTGEIELDGEDIAGIAVSIGARVGALAGPSEVFVSRTVKDLTAGSGLMFADAGEHELKGVPDRWQLYRVTDEASAAT
ncbi:MAG: adenylate/guanylate cyclase domain-containing protein [Actinomycetota bacterium]